MKTKILFSLVLLVFSMLSLFSQEPILKEKDPDANKFIGKWQYTSYEKDLSLELKKDSIYLGEGREMEILKGVWQVKELSVENSHLQPYAVMCSTVKNPNMLEGYVNDRSYGKRYYFTLEYTGSDEAVWKVVSEQKIGNPKAGAILVAPPTECVMRKVE